MAKSPKKPKPEEIEIETKPDAWERFEQTMDKIAPPKHRETKGKLKPKETDND